MALADQQPVILAENISKRYRRKSYRSSWRHEGFSLLSRQPQAAREQREQGFFWALQDISFQVAPGESVAIVGANGSGKTTLFRILCGITAPTTGQVAVTRQHMPLLSLGAGFNSELTGRENVFLNSAILGFPTRRVAACIDELIAFAGLEASIDTPIKFYSSGMRARLGISIALTLMPEIMFVDEVLAVGDAAFRNQCISKFMEHKAAGGTLLFVSHAESMIERICERAIWIDQGRLMQDGKTSDVLKAYLEPARQLVAPAHSAPPQAARRDGLPRVAPAATGTPALHPPQRAAGSLEKQLTPESRLVFLHMAKTGGTSLSTLLTNYFNHDQTCMVNDWQALYALPKDTLAEHRLLSGHFYYDMIASLLPAAPLYITMLREPIARSLSAIGHMQQRADHPLHRQTSNKTILDFLDSDGLRTEISNIQTMMLAAQFDREQPLTTQLVHRTVQEQLQTLDFARIGQLLEQLAFVGLTERFQESLFLLSYIFGWRPSLDPPRLNIAVHKLSPDMLTPQEAQALAKHNQHDLALYEYAQRRFDQQYLQMQQELAERYGTLSAIRQAALGTLPATVLFELLEQHYEQRYAQMYQPTDTLDLGVEQVIPAQGWYTREVHPRHGVFRWTGPTTQTSIDLPLKAERDLKISLRVITTVVPQALHTLRLTLNEQPIDLTCEPDTPDSSFIVTGRLPAAILAQRPGFARLTLSVDHTFVPKTIYVASKDTRALGVGLSRLHVEPA